jgi:hypothetical protein
MMNMDTVPTNYYNFQVKNQSEGKNLIPTKYGFKVSVEIVRTNGSASVYVHAPMYKNKLWVMCHSYCCKDFSDAEILNDRDFQRVMSEAFPED